MTIFALILALIGAGIATFNIGKWSIRVSLLALAFSLTSIVINVAYLLDSTS